VRAQMLSPPNVAESITEEYLFCSNFDFKFSLSPNAKNSS